MSNHVKQIRTIFTLTTTIILCSIAAIWINHFYFHFPGVSYFPDNALTLLMNLFLFYGASYLYFGPKSKTSKIMLHIIAYYSFLATLALLTTAAQYTPFTTIDNTINTLENIIPIKLLTIIAWTNQHSVLYNLLANMYVSLNLEMIFVPLFLIISWKRGHLYEYYTLMLTSALIGFVFYYFFPSSGPASVLKSHYFTVSQLATGQKFSDLHHYITPKTIEGGLIGIPSFHTIWAWLSVYAIRSFRPVYYILLPYNIMIILACVMLGWHFYTDILGSFFVLVLSHGFCVMQRTTSKWSESSPENHPGIEQISISNNAIL